jgi:magnesium transporter
MENGAAPPGREVESASDASAAAPAIEDASVASAEDIRVAELIEREDEVDLPQLAEAIEQQEAADAADTLEDLNEEQAAEVLQQMEDEAAAMALAEMAHSLAATALIDIEDDNPAYAARLLTLMMPDDAADILQAIEDENRREQLLINMPLERANELRRLVGYGEETAGGLMTTNILSLRDDMTVGEATDLLRSKDIPEAINELVVTDHQGKVKGRINLRQLLIHRARELVADLMETPVHAARSEMDREEVAREFDRYDYAMMPVVDHADRLLGVVTFDDVIDIIRTEQTEDVQRAVGAGAGEAVYSPLGEKFRGRFPWLMINLFTSSVAAIIVLQFDHLITELAILAVLMPVIANQAGNAGQQSLAVTLRGIVLDEVRTHRASRLVLREAAVGLINGFLAGLLVGGGLFVMASIVEGASWQLGLIAAVSMMCALSIGCFMGSFMPLLIRLLGFDPATVSTIFLTMTTDSVSFLVFLGIAQLLSHWLLPTG